MIIGKKCQNTPFFTRFPHCVEVFEEMVNNWRMREKGRDLTQSYDKSPYTNRNVKRGK